MADPYILSITRGDSYPWVFTLRNKTTRAIVDLTGATAILTASSTENPTDDTTKVFSINAVVDQVAAPGKLSFTPTISNTAQVASLFYDIQLTIGTTIRTVVKSTLSITQDITK